MWLQVEQRVRQMEDTVSEHAASLQMLRSKVRALEYKMDDAENRNRRNNLRLVRLPEGVEGKSPTAFMEELLRSLLPAAQFSSHYAVERAHRIPPSPNHVDFPPRTLIFRMLNFRDRDKVLRAARGTGEFKFQTAKLMFLPNFSMETQKLCRSFDQVKASSPGNTI